MNNIKTYFRTLLFSSIVFLFAYLLNWQGTALSPHVDIGFSLLRTAIFTYFSMLGFYMVYRFQEMYFHGQDEVDIDVLERFSFVLRCLKIFFAVVLGLQIISTVYTGYQSISGQTEATVFHYLLSELLNLFMAGSDYIRHHIEIIIRVNNPCILGYCTEDYPIVPYILAGAAFAAFRKMMKVQMTRGMIIALRNIIVKLLHLLIQLTVKIIHILRNLLSKVFRFAKQQSAKNRILQPLSIFFLDTSISIIWEELTLADYWIDRFNTFLLPPAPVKATLIQ